MKALNEDLADVEKELKDLDAEIGTREATVVVPADEDTYLSDTLRFSS